MVPLVVQALMEHQVVQVVQELMEQMEHQVVQALQEQMERQVRLETMAYPVINIQLYLIVN
jgi:hypothetical protein